MNKKTNVLILHTHDAGRYIEPYGYGIKTPNLMELAKDSVLFRKAFTPCPTCSPSRASLQTGMYPHTNGMLGLSHKTAGGFSLNNYNEHILHELKKHDYLTTLSGIQHIDGPDVYWNDKEESKKKHGTRIGYDVMLNRDDLEGPFSANMAAERAVEFIRNDNRPFYMSVGFIKPHAAFYNEHPNFDARYVKVPDSLPDTPQIREDMAGYMEMMYDTDRNMGMVIDALKQSGRYDDTLIIATTDHGIGFPKMKCNLKDGGTGIFLMVKLPNSEKRGMVIDEMVSNIDVYPTILDMLNIDIPERVQGKSLVPLIEGRVESLHEYIYHELTYHAAYEPTRAVRSKRYKYIRRFHENAKGVAPNIDGSRSKDDMVGFGLLDINNKVEELYDLYLDPNEMNNLIDDERYSEIKDELKTTLKTWMMETSDPIMNGPVYMEETHLISDQMAIDYGKKITGKENNDKITYVGW